MPPPDGRRAEGTAEGTKVMRNALARVLLIVPLLAAGIAIGAAKPVSAAVVCGDTLGVEEITGTVKDSLVVPPAGVCRLIGAVIRGGVTMGAGSILIIFANSEVRGAVSGTGVADLNLRNSVVRGSVTVSGEIMDVRDSTVRGDVALSGAIRGVVVEFSTVRGSVILERNNEIDVQSNAIDVDLRCSGNLLVSGFSGGNIVGGVATGECAGLVAP